MARLTIDTGTAGNPATGDTLRTAMTKINTNFTEVYSLIGDANNGLITTSRTNGDIKIQPNGTGNVEIDQLQITDTTITPITTNSDLTLGVNGTGGIIVAPADGKVGFFGATPVAQQEAIEFDPLANDGSTVEDLRSIIGQMLTVMRNYGLIES